MAKTECFLHKIKNKTFMFSLHFYAILHFWFQPVQQSKEKKRSKTVFILLMIWSPKKSDGIFKKVITTKM